jgi:hypothetical protein
MEPLSTAGLQGPALVSSPTLEIGEEAQTSLFPGIPYTTIAQVLKHPVLFNGQQVRLRGKVVDVRYSTSPIGSASTTFDLVDSTGSTVKVVTEEHITVRENLEVMVEGKLTLLHPAASSPSLMKVKAAHIVPISPWGKASVKPTVTLPPKRLPPSLPAVPSESPPKRVKDEGRIF